MTRWCQEWSLEVVFMLFTIMHQLKSPFKKKKKAHTYLNILITHIYQQGITNKSQKVGLV